MVPPTAYLEASPLGLVGCTSSLGFSPTLFSFKVLVVPRHVDVGGARLSQEHQLLCMSAGLLSLAMESIAATVMPRAAAVRAERLTLVVGFWFLLALFAFFCLLPAGRSFSVMTAGEGVRGAVDVTISVVDNFASESLTY
jgi:hypothetical protein